MIGPRQFGRQYVISRTHVLYSMTPCCCREHGGLDISTGARLSFPSSKPSALCSGWSASVDVIGPNTSLWSGSCFPSHLASWICIASHYIDGFVGSSRWSYTNSRSPVCSVNKSKQKSCLLVVIACILYVFSRCITSLESVDALRLVSARLCEHPDCLLDLYTVTRLNSLSWNLMIYTTERWDLVLCG